MTSNIRALTVGSAEIYVNGEKCGWVTNVEIEKKVELLRHESNLGLEFVTDHILPIRRSYKVSGRFGEIDPPTVNKVLGLTGLSTEALTVAQSMVEYPRLYKNRWYTLRYLPTGPLTLTTPDEVTTYLLGTDYEENSDSTAIKIKDGGAIVEGALLKLAYVYDVPAHAKVSLTSPGIVKPVHLVLVHHYPDGESFLEITLPRVVLDADVNMAFDEDDWMGVEFEGECLADESAPDSPFGYQRYFGPIFANQGESASDVPDNPYVPPEVYVN